MFSILRTDVTGVQCSATFGIKGLCSSLQAMQSCSWCHLKGLSQKAHTWAYALVSVASNKEKRQWKKKHAEMNKYWTLWHIVSAWRLSVTISSLALLSNRSRGKLHCPRVINVNWFGLKWTFISSFHSDFLYKMRQVTQLLSLSYLDLRLIKAGNVFLDYILSWDLTWSIWF